MEPRAILLLESGEALALALTWRNVGHVPEMTETEIAHAWSRVSGVSIFTARRVGRTLLAAKICLPGSELDPDAAAYLNARAFAEARRVEREATERDDQRPRRRRGGTRDT